MGTKGGSRRSKNMETTVYQSKIRIFHKFLHLLTRSILNNNNSRVYKTEKRRFFNKKGTMFHTLPPKGLPHFYT